MAWMEAILPGSTKNQFQTKEPPHLTRSATAPDLHDPAYLKYHEINVPETTPQPPVPARPELPPADNTYLPLLPPTEEDLQRVPTTEEDEQPPTEDERVKAVQLYTLEQVNLMIQMFENKVGRRPVACGVTDSKATVVVTKRTLNKPVKVSEHCSKHHSKGLYVSFAETMIMSESSTEGDNNYYLIIIICL